MPPSRRIISYLKRELFAPEIKQRSNLIPYCMAWAAQCSAPQELIDFKISII
jgi:hypothetical protein